MNILGVILFFILTFVQIWPVQVTQIHYTSEPYSFEKTSSLRVINKTFLNIIYWAEAHQSIKNTDNIDGTFNLNFIFDEGLEKPSNTVTVDLHHGEEKEVVSSMPISGPVNVPVTVNIIPPNKPVPQQTVITENVNLWQFIFHLYDSVVTR
jgi:hypothetical protein